jgi:hypothetical protein
MQQIPIRKCFWEAVETAIEAQAHRLARDIAATLQVSETPLLKALRTEKIGVYLYDDSEDQGRDMTEMKCRDLVRLHEDSPFIHVCGAPVLWPNTATKGARCVAHSLVPSELVGVNAICTQVLDYIQIDEVDYYIDKETSIIYSSSGEVAGKRVGGELRIFETEPTA